MERSEIATMLYAAGLAKATKLLKSSDDLFKRGDSAVAATVLLHLAHAQIAENEMLETFRPQLVERR